MLTFFMMYVAILAVLGVVCHLMGDNHTVYRGQVVFGFAHNRPRLGADVARCGCLHLRKEICAVFVMCHLIGWHALRCG